MESKGFLSKEEDYALDMLYTTLNVQMPNTDGIVLMESSPTVAFERAMERNTAADKMLDVEYLMAIHHRYKKLLPAISSLPVLRVPQHLTKPEATNFVASWAKSFIEILNLQFFFKH